MHVAINGKMKELKKSCREFPDAILLNPRLSLIKDRSYFCGSRSSQLSPASLPRTSGCDWHGLLVSGNGKQKRGVRGDAMETGFAIVRPPWDSVGTPTA